MLHLPDRLSPGVYLFSCLHFPIAVQEVSLDDRTDNGQPFACFQLGGKGQQSGIFNMKVFIQLQKHQELRPVVQNYTDI